MIGLSRLLFFALYAFIIALLLRMVLDWVKFFKADFKTPASMHMVYSITDWPLKKLRQVIPELKIGNIAFDLGFTLLVFVCFFVLGILR
ncbi:MAG: YggT family protein [Micrococcaceae bacterium]